MDRIARMAVSFGEFETREANIADRVSRRMVGEGLNYEGIEEVIKSIRDELDGVNYSVWFEGEDAKFLVSRELSILSDLIGREETLDEESLRSAMQIVRLNGEILQFESEVRMTNKKAKDLFVQIRNLGKELERKAGILSQKCEKVVKEIPR